MSKVQVPPVAVAAPQESYFRALFGNAPIACVIADTDGRIERVNAAFTAMLGYAPEEVIGRNVADITAPQDLSLTLSVSADIRSGTPMLHYAKRYRHRDGRDVWAMVTVSRAQVGARTVMVGQLIDVTERRSAQAALEASMSLLQTVIESAPVRVFWKDRQSRYLGCNTSFAKDAGMPSPDELVGKDDSHMGWHEQAELYRADDLKVMESGQAKLNFEEPQTTPQGRHIWLRTSKVPLLDARGDVIGVLGIYDDVTDRRQAESALIASETRFRTLIEEASDVVAVLDAAGVITYMSPAIFVVGGYGPAEVIGRNFAEFVHPLDLDAAAKVMASVVQSPGGDIHRSSLRYRHQDGRWRTFESAARNLLDTPPISGIVVNFRDVTDRERATRALSAISAANAVVVRASDENQLLREICRVLVRIGGYRMVWVGLKRDDASRSIEPVAVAGDDAGYLKVANIDWSDGPRGSGPVGRAIRSGQIQIVRDFQAEASTAPWHVEARARGYASCIGLPLFMDDEVIGSLALYASEVDAFDANEVSLLTQLAGDVAYGIGVLRDRVRHIGDLQLLEQSMEATVHAIASTVERRDRYTAGHQRRVAQLAAAIAGELGLDARRIHGLELAATIHDVGKIDVPAEILAKPGRLNPIELELVKTHAQAGYEILKDVKFPWPIADMVRQHHEKLDGSGYPQGLKGDGILLESRILTVADVVEAMSSHRPYRPALGPELALAEITRGRGTLFDAAAVDACLKLFREKAFTFDESPRPYVQAAAER